MTWFKTSLVGSLGGAAVWRLPLAKGAILETRDRIPRRAPGAWSLLLPLPLAQSLIPGVPGSRPWPKAGAKPLRHPGIPK